MDNRYRDGIHIDETIYMRDSRKKEFPFFMRMLQLAVIVAGSLSAVLIFADAFSISILGQYLYPMILLCSTAAYLIFLYPQYDIIKLPIAGLVYAVVIKRGFEALANGFYHLENAILIRFSEYYETPVTLYRANYLTEEEDITFLLIVILIPIIFLMAYTVVRSRLINLTGIVLLIPVVASFAFGITPDQYYLGIFLLILLFIIKAHGQGRTLDFKQQKFIIHRINTRTALVTGFVALIVYLMSGIILTEERYDEAAIVENTKGKLQNFIMEFSVQDVASKLEGMELFPKRTGTGDGGIHRGKLGQLDEVIYDGTEHLRVKASLDSLAEGIYLKGYVGSVYSGNRWLGHNSDTRKKYAEMKDKLAEGYEPMNGTAVFLNLLIEIGNHSDSAISQDPMSGNKYSFSEGQIEISYTKADKNYLYVPSYMNYSDIADIKYERDLYIKPNVKAGKYTYRYYYDFQIKEALLSNLSYLKRYEKNLLEYSEYEKAYREFVYEAYTQIPEEGLERIQADFSRERLGIRVDSLDKAISYVKDYLHRTTAYTLAPGRLPEDKEFVEYFIYENQVGYCVHYATSAVMMLRSLGYPARYVEGYTASDTDIDYGRAQEIRVDTVYDDQGNTEKTDRYFTASVKDYNAHAWVEVYVDGIGWFPVEFTPGTGFAQAGEVIGNAAEIGERITGQDEIKEPVKEEPEQPVDEEEPEKEEQKEPEDTTEKDPAQADMDKNEQDGKNKINNGTSEELSSSNSSRSIIKEVNTWIFIAIGVLVVMVIIILVLALKRKEARKRESSSIRAMNVYLRLEQLLILIKALPAGEGSPELHLDYIREYYPYTASEEWERFIDIIRKARFGPETISEEEFLETENFYRRVWEKVYPMQPSVKKILLRRLIIK